jgi:hypothetical protein
MPKKPETLFKEKVIRDLRRLRRIWFIKTNEVAVNGIPDFLICICGKFVALELKKEGKNRISKLQAYNLDLIEKSGGFSFTAIPSTWSIVYYFLKKIDVKQF